MATSILSLPTRPPDDLDLDVLAGIVADMRTQAQFLVKCLANNRDIDRDLWDDLARVAGNLFEDTDRVLCSACLPNTIRIGRGRGFDAVLCDDHQRQLLEQELSL